MSEQKSDEQVVKEAYPDAFITDYIFEHEDGQRQWVYYVTDSIIELSKDCEQPAEAWADAAQRILNTKTK